MQLMKEQCLLFRAQTRLAYEQTQLVALQAENLRKQSEIFTFQVPDHASALTMSSIISSSSESSEPPSPVLFDF